MIEAKSFPETILKSSLLGQLHRPSDHQCKIVPTNQDERVPAKRPRLCIPDHE
jgi:hypothetical protein